MTAPSTPTPRRVGLVLGAGGVTGFAFHVGSLYALRQRTSWDPGRAHLVIGTSAGSAVGALLRGGVSVEQLLRRQQAATSDPETMERLSRWATRPAWGVGPYVPSSPELVRRQLARPWRLGLTRLGTGLVPEGREPTERLGTRARALLGNRWPDEPYWACSVRLSDGRRVVFGKTHRAPDVGVAVEASSAIPGIFAPVMIDDERHVDGAVHSPTNADLAIAADLDLAIILSPMSAAPGAVRSIVDAPVRMWARALLRAEVAKLRARGVKTLVIEPDHRVIDAMGLNAMDPARIERTVDAARAVTDRAMDRSRNRAALELVEHLAAGPAPTPPRRIV